MPRDVRAGPQQATEASGTVQGLVRMPRGVPSSIPAIPAHAVQLRKAVTTPVVWRMRIAALTAILAITALEAIKRLFYQHLDGGGHVR